ncbi:MAG TPA: DUF6069 family protein [Micromonosporaceae bacterium]
MTDIQTRPESAAQGTCSRTAPWAVIGGATIAAVVDWTTLHFADGSNLAVRSGSSVQHIGAISVVAAVVIAGLAAWGLLAVLRRRVRNPRRTWTIIAVAVLAVSLLGPLGAVTLSAGLGLVSLHLVAGIALIVGFRRSCS